MLEQLRQWLEGRPGWGRAPDIAIDGLELAGSAVSLRPGGAAESRFREDILGGGELSHQLPVLAGAAAGKAPRRRGRGHAERGSAAGPAGLGERRKRPPPGARVV